VQCDSTEELQFDHILPVALGGATSIENLQILCADCNCAKSDAL
jgi:5-methylcytosine-specific restriction endonuclease McrA